MARRKYASAARSSGGPCSAGRVPMSRNIAARCRATTCASSAVANLSRISDIPVSLHPSTECAVVTAVTEVYHEPDHQPHDQPEPRVEPEREHETETRERAKNRDEGDKRRLEWSLEVGTRLPEHPHAKADQHEGEQGTDVDELAENLDRKKSGEERHGDSRDCRRQPRRLELRMHAAG